MASTYITRTFSGAGNRKTWTMSAWIKRTKLEPSSDIRVFGWKSGGGNYGFQFDSDKFRFYLVSGGSGSEFLTNRVFRDTNAWYHIVAKCDTTQSTASDRFKIYVNGVQETSFATATYPNLNEDTAVNQAEVCRLGCSTVAVNSHFDGLMSHVHFTDGYAYDASAFGSTDSTTGEWQINTSPSVTYGTNGFFLLKNDNAVTDRSGQGNNFTLGGGTLTKTEDNPSNNFATLNSKFVCQGQATTFSNGNTTGQSPTSQGCGGISSIGATSGKFYAEFKQSAESTTNEGAIGVCDTYYINNNDNLGGSSTPGYIEYSVGCFGLRDGSGGNFYSSSGSKVNNSSGTHANWVNGDIIMVAMDLDNNRLYFGKNGQWADSNTWSSATPSQYITLDSTGFDGCYHFAIGDSSSGNNVTWQANFGNGYFGTTAISSAGTNASGLGIFEYDVPSGYTALCTKGLNE